MNFLAADVPDPTDFPPQPEAPGLRTLDGSFRCDICGELFDAPVTISCGHCFCSACIRSALSNKQECPSCRKSAGEAHIRPNPALETVITAWKEARPYVLGLITREKARMSDDVPSDTSVSKKRKRSADRSTSPEKPVSKAGPSRHEADLATPKASSKMKKFKPSSSFASVVPSSDAEEDEITITGTHNIVSKVPKETTLVDCPACGQKVRYNILNKHLDNQCKDPPNPPSTVNPWSMLMNNGKNNQNKKGKQKKAGSDSDDEHPLPIASYNTLKDKQLKDMLNEHGLPLTGDRSTWEQRHQHWVIIYNSNLDKSVANRKKKSELKRDLKKWEEDMAKKKKQPAVDPVSYQKTHKSEFNRLIEEARKTRAKPAPELKKSDSAEAQAALQPVAPLSNSEANDSIVVDSEDERTGVLR